MSATEGRCYFHPTVPRVAVCSACGRELCAVCTRRLNTQEFCEACAANRHEQSPLAAGVFALLVPGLGQVYNGEFKKALIVFLTAWLVVPWVWGIVDAVRTAESIRSGARPPTGVPPGYLVLALKLGVVGLSVAYAGVVWAALAAVAWLVSRGS